MSPLRSPIHHAVSGRLALITVTGRQSGCESPRSPPASWVERTGMALARGDGRNGVKVEVKLDPL